MNLRYQRILWGLVFVGSVGCGNENDFGRPQAEAPDVVGGAMFDVVSADVRDSSESPEDGGTAVMDGDSTDLVDAIDSESDVPNTPDVVEELDTLVEDTNRDTGVIAADPDALGAQRLADGRIRVRILSANATRVEVWFYQEPDATDPGVLVLERVDELTWEGVTESPEPAIYYGLRAWGPNWPWDEAWEVGSEAGFIADVDEFGNRFSPNKLLVDVWAREISHDPVTPETESWQVYMSGFPNRRSSLDAIVPMGVVLEPEPAIVRPARPVRPLADDVIYEVHLRGLTMSDPSVPAELRGTYAGAALKARYLRELGVTAVEFLPLHETQNERNDVEASTDDDNYWGYASLSFFAPERRYAADRTPGGPTRELRTMVDAFHAEGIKVFVDVVYNHTGEGGAFGPGESVAAMLSWRGVDNASYYQTVEGSGYRNDNGVGPNMRFTSPITQRMVLDSLAYWHNDIGVDGFRFDLAAILGNDCDEDCFEFSSDGLLTDISAQFARDEEGVGADLIAEPWGAASGTYNLGNFPAGWHEWNDRYRVALRGAINRTPDVPTARDLAGRIFGSFDVFGDDGRTPDASVGYLVSHDGFTWNDLFSCDDKMNRQPWPRGPSDGGSDFNQGSDYDGVRAEQAQAARTAFAVVAASAGVPMLTGGDEFLRTQYCNNNPYNLDSVANWLDWSGVEREAEHLLFVTRMLSLRRMHEALRPRGWFGAGADRDDEGLSAITWYDINAGTPSEDYWANPLSPVMVWRVDTDEPVDGRAPVNESNSRSIAWLWNRSDQMQSVQLPPVADDTAWFRVADTAAWLSSESNSHPLDDMPRMVDPRYGVHAQSIVVLMERQVEVP